MKRAPLFVVAAVVALDLATRIGANTTVVTPEEATTPSIRGWCGGAWLATDAEGQRRGAAATIAAKPKHAVLVVGGAFTAGAGLADDELYPARFEPHARAGGYGPVAAVATLHDKVAEARRRIDELDPALVVLEIDATDLGADVQPYTIGVSGSDGASLVPRLPLFEPTWSGIATFLRRERWASARDDVERDVAELCRRDGFTGRAAAQAKLRLDAVTTALRDGTLAPRDTALLRALLADLHGLERTEERVRRLEPWSALFEELRRDQARRATVVLVTGPLLPVLALSQQALHHGLPVVHAAPFELDPQMRVAMPEQRPSAAVHAMVADSLWSLLTKRTLLRASAAAPAEVVAAADAVEQHVLARGGIEESFVTLAQSQCSADLVVGRGEPPVAAFRGVGADGAVAADRVAEVVLRRSGFPTAVVVRAEVAKGGRPSLRLRHFLREETAAPSVVATAQALDRDAELLEWRFVAPEARGPVDFVGFALRFGGAVRLRQVRFVE
jgi:hypothetical protein